MPNEAMKWLGLLVSMAEDAASGAQSSTKAKSRMAIPRSWAKKCVLHRIGAHKSLIWEGPEVLSKLKSCPIETSVFFVCLCVVVWKAWTYCKVHKGCKNLRNHLVPTKGNPKLQLVSSEKIKLRRDSWTLEVNFEPPCRVPLTPLLVAAA